MKFRALAVGAAVLVCAAAFAAPALAVQVDQSSYDFNFAIPFGFVFGDGSVLENPGVGQSYTAGIRGRLAAINLYCNGVCSLNPAGNNVTFSLYQGAALLKTVQTGITTGTIDWVNVPGAHFHFVQFRRHAYRAGPGPELSLRGGQCHWPR